MKDAIENSKFLAWLVKARSESQTTSLDILNIIRDYSNNISNSQEYSQIIHRLSSISFSLWRAVFLADREGGRERMLSDTEAFLARLVHDNAIAYPQDRATRSWSFVYYEQNARLRLNQLEAEWPKIFPKPPIPRNRIRTAQKRWDRTHTWLKSGIQNFRAVLAPD